MRVRGEGEIADEGCGEVGGYGVPFVMLSCLLCLAPPWSVFIFCVRIRCVFAFIFVLGCLALSSCLVLFSSLLYSSLLFSCVLCVRLSLSFSPIFSCERGRGEIRGEEIENETEGWRGVG